MKHLKKLIGAFLATTLLLSTAAAVPVEDVPLLGEETAVSEQSGYIVKLRDDVGRMRLQSADDKLTPIAHAGDYYVAQTMEEVLPYLEAGLVESLDANVRMELLDGEDDDTPPLTNDPGVIKQWYLKGIKAPVLWDAGLDGDGVTVALIDSGVLSGHEDFVGADLAGRNFCGGVVGGELQYADMYEDTNTNGHGTAVTGIIAARRNNELGIAGMLDKVKILALRCFSPDNTKPQNVRGNYVDTVISAVGYAMEQGADVINMSIGVKQNVTALEAKLREATAAGIILVAAAGNYGVTDPNTPIYPAAYDFVVSVAATKSDNHVMDSSQKNGQITVAAPGNAIWTTSNNGRYAELSGTSLASPIVTALAAVVKQKDAKIDAEGFVRLMQRSAIDRGDPGKDTAYGWGCVDAQNLVSALNSPYIISYETSGGTLPAEYKSIYRIAQDVGTELPVPTRGTHDVFVGWYLDEGLKKGPHTTLPAGCAGNITLWADWKQSALPEATVKLVGMNGIEDVTATQGEDGAWTAMLPDGTTSAFIASLSSSNIQITGVEATGVTKLENGTKWSFMVGDTPYVLNIPLPKPLRLISAWENTAMPPSPDGKIAAVACRMPVAEWFTGEIASFAKAAADLPKELGSLGMTSDKKTMVFTPTAAAAGQTLTARIYARNNSALSEPVTVTIVVGKFPSFAEKEALFQRGADGDISVAMDLVGSAVTGVKFADETLTDAAYAVEGETLVLKAEWLNTLDYGDYTLAVSFATGTSATLTLKVRIPKPVVTLNPATAEGVAVPASLDGLTAAEPFVQEDVSGWFGGEVTEYFCTVTGGAVEAVVAGSKVTYTPAAEDAGKDVTLAIRAKNDTGDSEPVTVKVSVGALPKDMPKLTDTEMLFQKNADGDTSVGMVLNDSSVSEVKFADETLTDAAYAVEGETLVLKAEWLNTLDYGDYTLTVSFATGTSATLTIKVRIPKPVVTLDPATAEGVASLASLDGLTAAVPFAQDVSAWFDGEVTEYLCTVTIGAGEVVVEGGKITYTPAAADAEQTVTLAIRAKNGTGESDAVTVTVAVAAVPPSDPSIGSAGLTFKMTSDPVDVPITWNGATLTKITCDDTEVAAASYTLSEDSETHLCKITLANAWLKTLTVGEHTLRFHFGNCRTENLSLPLTLTVSNASTEIQLGGLSGAIAGIAQAMASNLSVEIPEANVTMFYTANGGKVDLSVDDAEAARLAQCDTASISFREGDVYAAQLTDKIYRSPKSGTFLRFPKGSFFIRSTVPASGNRTFALNSPSQNVWYVSLMGESAGVTVLLPCENARWKVTLRTATGERVLPSVYDTKEGCLRVVMPESGTLTLTQNTTANPFKDVAAGAWYADAVLNAYSTNLLQGVSADNFAPDTPVSRAMLVTILRRLSGNTENVATTFTDVATNSWYASAAAWAQKENLVNGYPDGSFRPDAPVSRQELMTIFWRFATKQGAAKESSISSIANYADVTTLAEYAVAPVSGMVANGIVNGVGSNPARLAPNEGATRAQLAVILQRFVEHLSGK